MKRVYHLGSAIIAGMLLLAGGSLVAQDLCERVDMKPVLSLAQVRQNELIDFIVQLTGLKNKPGWPADISNMTPEQYYQMEVNLLVQNGFPAMFREIEPDRLVNRRYFASLMFQIAIQANPQMQKDCANAVTETDQFQCLVDHDYIYSAEGKIYRDEILSILCNKKGDLLAILPRVMELLPPMISPYMFNQAVLEAPVSPI
jgi:hypothetical protein